MNTSMISTVVVVAIIAVAVFVAFKYVRKNGACSGCSHSGGCTGCPSKMHQK
ncbi:FeoB-associated Cys-rich membrane protein [Peptostreptococcus equinus]|uniref:FeoB-associated Cys-rich membrane protein n=1 Tax=Peptostreptococcus equinus TaxID=3003601 RepID=A0ABY7JQ78_9FIRM|nr:FeoB-associated Cys-rich membrane protein [Peptostreptococcus sp. CBA3647]WAW14656.1 FeoB-associated Cys-rich membrane protein [Peptostreptococcus sp. CBA3647]